MVEQSLKRSIEKCLSSGKETSKKVYTAGTITDELFEKHCSRYANGAQDECPILIVNNKIAGSYKGYSWSGLMITNKALYYKCIKDTSVMDMTCRSE